MYDHFDSRSYRRNSTEWLLGATADAELKRRECVATGNEAHAKMWSRIGAGYLDEVARRDMAATKKARRGKPPCKNCGGYMGCTGGRGCPGAY